MLGGSHASSAHVHGARGGLRTYHVDVQVQSRDEVRAPALAGRARALRSPLGCTGLGGAGASARVAAGAGHAWGSTGRAHAHIVRGAEGGVGGAQRARTCAHWQGSMRGTGEHARDRGGKLWCGRLVSDATASASTRPIFGRPGAAYGVAYRATTEGDRARWRKHGCGATMEHALARKTRPAPPTLTLPHDVACIRYGACTRPHPSTQMHRHGAHTQMRK